MANPSRPAARQRDVKAAFKEAAFAALRHARPVHPDHRLGHAPEHRQRPGARSALGRRRLGRRHRLRRPLPGRAAPADARRAQGDGAPPAAWHDRLLPAPFAPLLAVRPRLPPHLPDHRDHARGLERRAEMDRQFRRPDPDLRHARLGAEHRRRPRRPARSRLCRLLRGRRLFLRAARQEFRPVVLDPAADRRASSPPSGACCSASRCCACAATISPS